MRPSPPAGGSGCLDWLLGPCEDVKADPRVAIDPSAGGDGDPSWLLGPSEGANVDLLETLGPLAGTEDDSPWPVTLPKATEVDPKLPANSDPQGAGDSAVWGLVGEMERDCTWVYDKGAR